MNKSNRTIHRTAGRAKSPLSNAAMHFSRIIGIFATLALLGATAAADRASKDCPDCPETRTKDRAFDAFPLAKMDLKKMTCGSG